LRRGRTPCYKNLRPSISAAGAAEVAGALRAFDD
jgi:hypothetical protein